MAAPEELNPSQNRGGTVVSTKYPNPAGARRHWHWRTRIDRSEVLGQLDCTQHLKETTDATTLGRRHLRLASEGFSLSAANADVRELLATLYH